MDHTFNEMINYIERLNRCGVNISEATRTVFDMQKNYGWEGLEEYVNSVEDDVYVDSLQKFPMVSSCGF